MRRSRTDELAGDVAQAFSTVILSPSGLAAQRWPACELRRGDFITIDGRLCHVEAVEALKIGDTVVRIEVQAKG